MVQKNIRTPNLATLENTLQPRWNRGNCISFPGSARTFSFGARLTPLNQPLADGKQANLASLAHFSHEKTPLLGSKGALPVNHDVYLIISQRVWEMAG